MSNKRAKYAAGLATIALLTLLNIVSPKSIFSSQDLEVAYSNSAVGNGNGLQNDINPDNVTTLKKLSRLNRVYALLEPVDITSPYPDLLIQEESTPKKLDIKNMKPTKTQKDEPKPTIKVLAITNGPSGPIGLISVNGTHRSVKIGDTISDKYKVSEIGASDVRLVEIGF